MLFVLLSRQLNKTVIETYKVIQNAVLMLFKITIYKFNEIVNQKIPQYRSTNVI